MIRLILIYLLTLTATVSLRGASPIEGDWRMSRDGALLRIRASNGNADSFDIIWLDGPDFSIEPGKVIGHAFLSPTPGVYDCSVMTDPRGRGDKHRYARFVIRLDADTADSFTLAPYEQGVKFSPLSLLPYWWRRPLRPVDTRPSGLDGARKVGAPKQFVEL